MLLHGARIQYLFTFFSSSEVYLQRNTYLRCVFSFNKSLPNHYQNRIVSEFMHQLPITNIISMCCKHAVMKIKHVKERKIFKECSVLLFSSQWSPCTFQTDFILKTFISVLSVCIFANMESCTIYSFICLLLLSITFWSISVGCTRGSSIFPCQQDYIGLIQYE